MPSHPFPPDPLSQRGLYTKITLALRPDQENITNNDLKHASRYSLRWYRSRIVKKNNFITFLPRAQCIIRKQCIHESPTNPLFQRGTITMRDGVASELLKNTQFFFTMTSVQYKKSVRPSISQRTPLPERTVNKDNPGPQAWLGNM